MNELLSLERLTQMSNADLSHISSQITGRLNNEDWQQVILDLRASNHIQKYHESAPLFLQRFIRLEIDLDTELSRRFSTAPLLSEVSLRPDRPTPKDIDLVAQIASQDRAATMTLEIDPQQDTTGISFTLRSMLTIRFPMDDLDREERRLFLMLLGRDQGMTVLWTLQRWESSYIIFIKEEFFTRLYAFSGNLEATARLTNEATGALSDWLRRCWFPRQTTRRARG